MWNSVAMSPLILLCKHCLLLSIPRTYLWFSHTESLHPLNINSQPTFLSWNTMPPCYAVCTSLVTLSISHIGTIPALVLLRLAFFTWHDISKAHPCCTRFLNTLSFILACETGSCEITLARLDPLCNTRRPWTWNPPVSASRVPGLQVWATTMPRSECPFTRAIFHCSVPCLCSSHYFILSVAVLFQCSFVDSLNSLGAKTQAKPVARCCPKAKELCEPRSQHWNSALCQRLDRSAVTKPCSFFLFVCLFVSSNGSHTC